MWVHVDDLPTPIAYGWKGINQSVEVAMKKIKQIEGALETKHPSPKMFHKKREFVSDDLWSRHEDIVEAWCDRLENIAKIIPDELAFDKKRLEAWNRLSPAKKKEEIEANKKWSQDILRRAKACEDKATKLKLEFRHNSHSDLHECKATAEELTYIYTKQLKAQTGPAPKRRKVEPKQSTEKTMKYEKVDEQMRMDTMFFGQYLKEFRNAINHCQRAYPGGNTHAANMTVHLIKAGVHAVNKARLAGRHPEQFRLLAALTFAAFAEPMWFTETEDDEKDRQKLMNLVGKEWQQLIGGEMWNPAVLKVRSKTVLDQIVLRLDEAKEFVQEWADDVDTTTSFDYKSGMRKKFTGKKLAAASKSGAATTATKTRIMKVMKTSKKTAKKN